MCYYGCIVSITGGIHMENQLILNGTTVANDVKEKLKERAEQLVRSGLVPCLATILVGDDPSSETYVRMKGNACKKLGIESRRIHLPAETTTEELLEVIQSLQPRSGSSWDFCSTSCSKTN